MPLHNRFDLYLGGVVYVCLRPDHVTLIQLHTRKKIEKKPWLALIGRGRKKHVIAVGEDAAQYKRHPVITFVHPFDHPRTLTDDYANGQRLFRHLIDELYNEGKWQRFFKRMLARLPFAKAPTFILHLLLPPASNCSELEWRNLEAMASLAGARNVIRCNVGHELSAEEAALFLLTPPA